MKHINLFENFNNYIKYLNKYFILMKFNDDILMCKMLNIDDAFINWEEYDYNHDLGYDVLNQSLHIKDFEKYFKILNYFDSFKEMKKEYEIIKKSEKYNL